MRRGSLALVFLKNKVFVQTPNESRYLIRVGKRGKMLKFFLYPIDNSSKLNYSPPIFDVQP